MKNLITIGLLFFHLTYSINHWYAQPGENDSSFNPGNGANAFIQTIAIQNDGKILIGGYFTSYGGVQINRIARLNSDGSLDTTFNIGTGLDNAVLSIAIQNDGKIILSGWFTSFNGTSINRIARLNSDGSIDATFNPGSAANGIIRSCQIQNDGQIIIAGHFTSFNGTQITRIARLNVDGSLDLSFNPGSGANDQIWTCCIQNDGKIIVVGDFLYFNGLPINRITRLNPNGSLDPNFNTGAGANSIIMACPVQNDGKIVVAGNFTSFNGIPSNYITRINPNGSQDIIFNSGSGASDLIMTSQIQSDGKIIIGGSFTSYNGIPRNLLARLNSDGSLDFTFNPGLGADFNIYSSAIQNDGKILIGGDFNSYNGFSRNKIARVLLDCIPNTGTDIQSSCTSFTWIDGITYSTSNNSAQFILTNVTGCDSVVTLDLTINEVNIGVTINEPLLTANATGATFQWIDCLNGNEIIPNETNQTFTASVNGNYAVIVNENGCSDTSSCITLSNISLGEFIDETLISLFPNPTNSNININFSEQQSYYELRIFDTKGTVINEIQGMDQKDISIDMVNYNPGVYFIEIKNHKEKSMLKFILT